MPEQAPILNDTNSLATAPKTCCLEILLQSHSVTIAGNWRVRVVSIGCWVSKHQSQLKHLKLGKTKRDRQSN